MSKPVVCECGHTVKREYPKSGPLEVLEVESWDHAPDCPRVLRAIADEDGPWNDMARKRLAEDAKHE